MKDSKRQKLNIPGKKSEEVKNGHFNSKHEIKLAPKMTNPKEQRNSKKTSEESESLGTQKPKKQDKTRNILNIIENIKSSTKINDEVKSMLIKLSMIYELSSDEDRESFYPCNTSFQVDFNGKGYYIELQEIAKWAVEIGFMKISKENDRSFYRFSSCVTKILNFLKLYPLDSWSSLSEDKKTLQSTQREGFPPSNQKNTVKDSENGKKPAEPIENAKSSNFEGSTPANLGKTLEEESIMSENQRSSDQNMKKTSNDSSNTSLSSNENGNKKFINSSTLREIVDKALENHPIVQEMMRLKHEFSEKQIFNEKENVTNQRKDFHNMVETAKNILQDFLRRIELSKTTKLEMENTIISTKEAKKDLERAILELKSEKNDLMNQINIAKQEKMDLKNEIEGLKSLKFEAEKTISQLASYKNVVEESFLALDERKIQIDERIKASRSVKKELEDSLIDSKRMKFRLEKAAEDLTDSTTKYLNKIESAEKSRKDLENTILSSNSAKLDLDNSIVSTQTTKLDLEKTLNDLKNVKSEFESKMSSSSIGKTVPDNFCSKKQVKKNSTLTSGTKDFHDSFSSFAEESVSKRPKLSAKERKLLDPIKIHLQRKYYCKREFSYEDLLVEIKKMVGKIAKDYNFDEIIEKLTESEFIKCVDVSLHEKQRRFFVI